MVQKVLTAKRDKRFSSAILLFFVDIVDAIKSTGVVVDNAAYDTGIFKDRDYDVRQFKGFFIALENIGANSVDFTIRSTTKDFTIMDSDITDDDFDKEEVAETAIVAGTPATGSVDLTAGASGSVDTIKVNGIDIMSASVPFNTSLAQTAIDVAANITANTSNPNYTASAAAGLITITAVNNEASTDTVVSTSTTITTVDVNMSGGASGKSTPFVLERKTPEITVIRLRAKETSGGSPGTIRADVRGL